MIRAIWECLDHLLGLPIRMSGRVHIGRDTRVRWRSLVARGRNNRLTIGDNSIFHATVSFDAEGGEVIIGNKTYIGRSHIVCHSRVVIGNDVIISWGVTIVDHDSHAISWKNRASDVSDWASGSKNWEHVRRSPVTIEDKVWIGFNASILKGVTVGEGAIIGAGSVVTKDVPPFTVVAGNPARVVRELTNCEE